MVTKHAHLPIMIWKWNQNSLFNNKLSVHQMSSMTYRMQHQAYSKENTRDEKNSKIIGLHANLKIIHQKSEKTVGIREVGFVERLTTEELIHQQSMM